MDYLHLVRRAKSSNKVALAAAAVAAIQAMTAGSALAQTYNGSASGTWSTGAGWTLAPVSDAATALTFNVGTVPAATSPTYTSTNDNTSFQLNAITLSGTGPATSGLANVTINGNPLQFVVNGVTGPTITNSATKGNGASTVYSAGLRHTFTAPVALSTDLSITGNGTAPLEFSGGFSGTGDINKSGTSVLALNGTNGVFTGDLNLTGGTIWMLGANTPAGTWVTNGNLNLGAGVTFNPAFSGSASVGNIAVGSISGTGTFSGARTIAVNYNGGTVDTFSGAISGNPVIAKNGVGTLQFTNVLATAAGTTPVTAITNNWGTFIAPAVTGQAASIAVNNGLVKVTNASGLVTGGSLLAIGGAGTVAIAPGGSGANVTVTGGTIVNGTTPSVVRANGGRLVLDRGNNTSLNYVYGAATATATLVSRPGVAGGLVIAPAHGLAALGSTEKFTLLGSSAAVIPTQTNGILPAWIVGQDNDPNLSGDFLAYSGTAAGASDTGFVKATYSANTDINAGSATTVYDADSSGGSNVNTLSGTASVYAINTRGQAINLNGNTLNVGLAPAALTGQAGIIMNGGSISGAGQLNFDVNEGNVYVSNANGTISSQIRATRSSNAAAALQVSGPGVLTLSNTNNIDSDNALAGSLAVTGGATLEVGLVSKTNSNGGTPLAVQSLSGFTGPLALRGGVLQVLGSISDTNTLTRALGGSGTGLGNLNFSNGTGGGFAARGGNLIINIGGSVTPQSLTWTQSSFLSETATLMFGSKTADSMVDWTNPLNLGGTVQNFTRVINVVDNPSSTTDVIKISGAITSTGPNNGIAKDGDGTLILTGINTYTGATTINGGVLQVNNSAATPLLTALAGTDLVKGKLVFDYAGGSSPASTVSSILDASFDTGFAAGQIRSTGADGTHALGWVEDIGAETVTVALTHYGDANLDGFVDSGDFGILAGNWLGSGKVWGNADFNYDGLVDSGDFGILAGNWNSGVVNGLSIEVVAMSLGFDLSAVAAVPEPGTVGLLAVASLAVLRRRVRRNVGSVS